MNVLKTVITFFMIIEATNVIALYFFPGEKYANAVGIFTAWKKSQNDPAIHDFVKYLVNWVAGTKLIFILLLLVIINTLDEEKLIWVGVAMAISIASFYWRLFPLIRKMDKRNEIEPKNYSTALGWIIFVFIGAYAVAIFAAIN